MAVVGTGTGVGKTWVACRLAAALAARGLAVAARKPAQSYEPGDDRAARTDAQRLARATGEDPAHVCLPDRWYPVALAPPMAAEALGRPAFTVADLAGGLRWPPAAVGLLETAGGLRSPQAADGDGRDLLAALRPDVVVVVAPAGLGVIHAVRSVVEDLDGRPALVVLNAVGSPDEAARRSRTWLEGRDGLAVYGLPGEEAALVDAVLGA